MPTQSSAVEHEQERTFDAPDHIRIPDLPDASVVAGSRVRLTATYWDTVHRHLLRWGHSLRHPRASDGSEDRWTLKLALPSKRTKGELERTEVHGSGSALFPPAALRSLAGAIVRKGLLEPMVTVITERHWVELTGRDPEERVKVSDDRVSSVRRLRRGPAFRQIEVEADSPAAEHLMDEVSEALIGSGATPTETAMIAKVMGEDAADPEIVLPRPSPKISVEDLMRFAIGSGATRLIVNDPAARLGSDPEAIHQARVATRRLRSDLKTLEPLVDPAAGGWIRDELAWVGELLGSVRDTDVLIERVRTLARELQIEADVAAIVTELEVDRRRRQVELLEGLRSRRYVRLVKMLIDASVAPPLGDDVDGERRARPRLRKLAGKSWRRLARGVKRLSVDPTDAELHEIRKRAKRARYAAELAAGALHEDAEPLAHRLAALQDVLGELQDAVVADDRLTTLVREDRLSAQAAFAAGKLACVVGEARWQARSGWPAAWKAARAKRLRTWLA
jgi:CHAD domain-containing protein